MNQHSKITAAAISCILGMRRRRILHTERGILDMIADRAGIKGGKWARRRVVLGALRSSKAFRSDRVAVLIVDAAGGVWRQQQRTLEVR